MRGPSDVRILVPGGGGPASANTGNNQINPNPSSMPGRGNYGPSASPYAPQGPVQSPGIGAAQPIINSALYQTFNGLGFVLASSGDSNLMLNDPGTLRVYLEIRVSAASAGSLFIGLDNTPTSIGDADFIVNPGETKVFGTAVPQNRLYGFASGGGVVARIVSANAS